MTKKTWLAIVGFALAVFVVAAQADLQRVAVSQLTSTATGTQNDFATIGYDVVRWNGASAVTFTGFNGAQAGRILIVDNVTSAQTMTFSNATGSTASYQLNTPGAVSLVCPAKSRAWLRYDSTLTKWIVSGGAGCYSQATTTLGGDPRGMTMASGRYYFVPNINSLTTSGALGNGSFRMAPQYIPNTITVTRMGAEVTVIGESGSKIRLGIYADDGTGKPGDLVLDAGQIAGDSATVQEITGLSTAIGPGWYWFGGAVQSAPTTQPTMRIPGGTYSPLISFGTSMPGAASAAHGYGLGSVTGALPSSASAATVSGLVLRVFIKT